MEEYVEKRKKEARLSGDWDKMSGGSVGRCGPTDRPTLPQEWPMFALAGVIAPLLLTPHPIRLKLGSQEGQATLV